MTFKNRMHAGKLLARALEGIVSRDAIALALPRGGVPVGFAVARALGVELDVLLVRKLGLPGHEEFAMGALAGGGVRVLNQLVLRKHQVSPAMVEAICSREQAEIERRERQYRGARPPPQLAGRELILVDDGLATGSTMRAAIALAQQHGPARIVVAVPVGAPDTCAALARDIAALVCLEQPLQFRAVSQWYREFEQTSDGEVQDLLALAWRTPLPKASALHSLNHANGGNHESGIGTRSAPR